MGALCCRQDSKLDVNSSGSSSSVNSGGCFKNSCNNHPFEKKVDTLVSALPLNDYKKKLIKKRFVNEVVFYETNSAKLHYRYNMCRFVISIGSMILPTLQTIQNNENVADFKDELFWTAIFTSLSVMVANNIISMFTLDRRYIMYAVTKEKLKAVGWKYFELSGMFTGRTHSENWVLFWNEIEKIKKLQIIAEYTDHDDKKDDESPGVNKEMEEKEQSEKEYKQTVFNLFKNQKRDLESLKGKDNINIPINELQQSHITPEMQQQMNNIQHQFTTGIQQVSNGIEQKVSNTQQQMNNGMQQINNGIEQQMNNGIQQINSGLQEQMNSGIEQKVSNIQKQVNDGMETNIDNIINTNNTQESLLYNLQKEVKDGIEQEVNVIETKKKQNEQMKEI